MDEQHFCPDNSGYAEKRVQSYYFFSYLANFQRVSSLFSRRFNYFSFLSSSFPTDFTDFTDLFCIFASRKQNIVKGMKKKNSMQMMLASMALMLMASPAFAQKFKVAKVERTRILIDRKWDAQPDAEAAKFIAPYQHKVDSIMGPVVGSVAHDMTRHRPESELSNLLSDILVWGGRQFNEQPVFSVYNMGGIRADFAKGDINVGDVSEVAPFENKICFLTLTGEKVLELFQQIAHRGGEGVSHAVRMVITPDGKLKGVTLNGEPVDPAKSYRIATLDYLAEGNDQLVAFKSGTDVVAPKAKENNVRYIIMDYFREMKAQGKVVESRVEGRCVVE